MKHLFVPYNIALTLKEKGFDEGCLTYYVDLGSKKKSFMKISSILVGVKKDNSFDKATFIINSNLDTHSSCAAPLYQQVIDWFREKYNIIIFVEQDRKLNKLFKGVRCYYIKDAWKYNYTEVTLYYEALNKAIEEVLKLI